MTETKDNVISISLTFNVSFVSCNLVKVQLFIAGDLLQLVLSVKTIFIEQLLLLLLLLNPHFQQSVPC